MASKILVSKKLAKGLNLLGLLLLGWLLAPSAMAQTSGPAPVPQTAAALLAAGEAADKAFEIEKAKGFYEQACGKGSAKGCYEFASKLSGHGGYVADNEKAALLFEKACNMGYYDGCVGAAGLWYNSNNPAKDIKRGNAMMEKACDYRVTRACESMAEALTYGKYEPVDYAGARRFSEKGCALNSSYACIHLGNLHKEGRGGERSDPLALKAYAQSCKLDQGSACNLYARMLKAGEGGPKNEALAYTMFQKACRLSKAADSCFERPPGPITAAQRAKDVETIQMHARNAQSYLSKSLELARRGEKSCRVNAELKSNSISEIAELRKAARIMKLYPANDPQFAPWMVQVERGIQEKEKLLEALKSGC